MINRPLLPVAVKQPGWWWTGRGEVMRRYEEFATRDDDLSVRK